METKKLSKLIHLSQNKNNKITSTFLKLKKKTKKILYQEYYKWWILNLSHTSNFMT